MVIATHNNAKNIGACIDSLWNGGFSEFEVIAVDVNSTDGTKDILAKMAAEEEQITFLADSLGSIGHAKNIGMDHARAPYIIFADPDGFFYKDAIEYMCHKLEEDPDSDMFTCKMSGSDIYGRTDEDRKKSIIDANKKDNRQQEVESRLMRSWMFDHITMYRSSFLYGKGIRHYEKPGYGSQDNAFCFLAMSRGMASISADVKYSFSNDLYGLRITDADVVVDVCNEFRFLKEQLQKESQLWWRMRLVYWQAYYERNMLLYELLSDDLRPKLSKKLQADIKEAIYRKEFSRDHFDVRVRDEMELLMISTKKFDEYKRNSSAEHGNKRVKESSIDNRLAEIAVIREDNKIERLSRESAEKTKKLCMENSINRKWLMEEMTRNLASLRKMLGITPEEMSNLLGISESTYKNLETGKKEMSWDQFMSLLFIFNFNDRTSSMADALGLFPDILKKRIKKGIISVYV